MMTIREAIASDLVKIQLLKDTIKPFNSYTPKDIKETYIYEDENYFGFLCTTHNMKHIVAVGGSGWTNLIRYYHYRRINK